jgi:anti-anti-sigma factor
VTSCQPFRIEQIASTGESALVVSVHGELDYFTVASLRLYLRSLAAEEVVIRLHDLSFLDSSGLALLLELKGPGRSVRFEGISGQVRETMQRTGTLDSIEA